MPSLPDEDNFLPLSAPVRPGAEADLLPALKGDTVTPVNPARAYLISLNSLRSRQTMASFLNTVARILGARDLTDCSWAALRRHHVLALTEMLRDTGLAVATINTYLSALRGVALEAWMLKLMSVEDYQHIRAVRSVRGSALPRGRALAGRKSVSCSVCARRTAAAKASGMRRCWAYFSDAACVALKLWH